MATVAPPQHLSALRKANAKRMAAVAVKNALKAGQVSFAEALADEDAGCVTIFDLLACQRQWGPDRARRALKASGSFASEGRRVDELSVRQCLLIAAAAAATKPATDGRGA